MGILDDTEEEKNIREFVHHISLLKIKVIKKIKWNGSVFSRALDEASDLDWQEDSTHREMFLTSYWIEKSYAERENSYNHIASKTN